jgi:hypothetical protein
MSRKLFGVVLLLFCLACARPGIRETPPAGNFFQALTIKFNFSDPQGKQNGRIYWRFDARNAKFIFFTPLNQVGLELNVAGETALLLRPGKNLCWRGGFSLLIGRLWGIELKLEELKQLILKGSIPQVKMTGKDISINLETDPEDLSPRIVHIRQNESELTLKIVGSETRPGRVVLLDHDRRCKTAELEEILGDD